MMRLTRLQWEQPCWRYVAPPSESTTTYDNSTFHVKNFLIMTYVIRKPIG